jgi:hypothetical protein
LRRGSLDLAVGFALRQIQASHDVFQYIRDPQQNIVIPISQDPITLCFQHKGSPLVVSSLLDMLTTIQLDDQLQLMTQEVGNVTCYRDLSSELKTTQLLQSKMLPEAALGIGS